MVTIELFVCLMSGNNIKVLTCANFLQISNIFQQSNACVYTMGVFQQSCIGYIFMLCTSEKRLWPFDARKYIFYYRFNTRYFTTS